MKTHIVEQKRIPLGEIIWREGFNFSREDGNLFADDNDRKAVIHDLYSGWNDVVGQVFVRELDTIEEKSNALEQRMKEIETLEKLELDFTIKLEGDDKFTNATPSEQLRIKKQTCTNAKTGKIIQPKYEGVFAFRRSNVLNLVNTFRFKKTLPLVESIPCTVKVYEGGAMDLDRINDCIFENTLKIAGAKRLDPKDKAHAAHQVFMAGGSEADLTRLFRTDSGKPARGEGQKYYGVCMLNKLHEELNILGSIKNGTFPVQSWDKEKLRELWQEKVSTEDVKEYLLHPNDGPSPVKGSSRKDTLKVAVASEIYIVEWILTHAANGTLSEMARTIYPFKKVLNEVYPKPKDVMAEKTAEGVKQLVVAK